MRVQISLLGLLLITTSAASAQVAEPIGMAEESYQNLSSTAFAAENLKAQLTTAQIEREARALTANTFLSTLKESGALLPEGLISKFLPTSINPVKVVALPAAARIRIDVDKVAQLRVRARLWDVDKRRLVEDSDGKQVIKAEVVTPWSSGIHVAELGLEPDTWYDLEIVALDLLDRPKVGPIDGTGIPRLRFQTPPPGADQIPSLTVLAQEEKRATTATINFTLSTKAFVEIACERWVEMIGFEACPTTNKVAFDPHLRVPVGDPLEPGEHSIQVEGLIPESKYKLTPVAYSPLGSRSSAPHWAYKEFYKTLPLPRLEIAQPVEIALRPTGLRVTWRTTEDISSGWYKVILKNKDFYEVPVEPANPRELQHEVNVRKLQEAVASGELPVIEVGAKNDRGSAQHRFKLAIELPKNATARQEAKLTDTQAKAVDALFTLKEKDKGKVKWETLKEVAIPILLSFI